MKSIFRTALAVGLVLAGASVFAGQTSTFLTRRLGKSADITPGKWHRNFSKAKSWAIAQGVPFIAVWSNGDNCGHCVKFEQCLNTTTFKNWEKASGMVFWFGYSGDSEYQPGCSVFEWVRNKKNVNYPFVRVYWEKSGVKKVDIATIGDAIDVDSKGSLSASALVSFFKNKLKAYKPFDPNMPYTIDFQSNVPDDYEYVDGDVTNNVPVDVVYADVVKATNVFELADFKLIGWSATPGSYLATKYAVGASLSGLTTKSNEVVSVYGQWAHKNYTVEFDANYTPGALDGDSVTNMPSAVLEYGVSTNLPKNVITRKDYTFSGWATTPTGKVAYKNAVAVKDLTRKSSIKLYAIWVRTTFRTYYTGVKYTITALTSLKGRTISGSFPGMTWSKSTGKFTGTPKTAGTYKIGFKKSGATTIYRYFVVVKDAISIPDASSDRKLDTDTSTVADIDVGAISGKISSSKVTGLPEGMKYDATTGKITGRPLVAGTYTVKVTGKNVKGQSLSATYTFNVAEGDTVLISGLAHFDEFWAECDESISLPLRLRIRLGEAFDVIKPTEAVDVKLLRPVDGGWVDADPVYGTLAYDAGTATLVGEITGECIEDENPFSEFKVEISTVYEDEAGERRDIFWAFPLKVYVTLSE